ncbi:MAG: fused MFS/spermidine synthase [Nitrosomonadales bacterium]|nr:fused MFS/spermidine synthase [Nitrosomonadales bacterium]
MDVRNYKYGLLFFVTLTGMAVLIVEIAATRILAPFFGNSIFTFSSVISIILAALSLGYYFGGRLSDRKPSNVLFCGLIVIAGFTVLLLQLLNATVLPGMAHKLSMISGPLIVSLMMFLLPALFLGMLSPFAIKLLHSSHAEKGVGNAAGLVFFWSTLGSIAGSLSAGFLLIPHWGVGNIMIGVGLGLVLLGSIGMLVLSGKRRIFPISMILLGLLCGFALKQFDERAGKGVVYVADGLYEKIVIRDIAYQGRNARILLQDRNISSGMFIDDGSMAFDYTKYFDLYRLFTPGLKTALAIGGGAYSVPKAILHDSPKAIVDVVETDPSLHGLAKEYFALPDDPRLRNHVIDGRRFLHDTPEQYDLIFSDAYRSFISVPMQFTTREFFSLAKSKLKGEGVFIANYYGSLGVDTRPMIYSVLKTMRSVFSQVYLIATVNPESDELQNLIFIGHNADKRIDLQQAAAFKFAYPVLNKVAGLELRPAEDLVESAFLLTDDFAPVEYYAANVIRKYDAASRKVN